MTEPARATDDAVEAIARAVLYEGYLLWPYRRSARKNQTRFNFGALYPPGFCARAREGDASSLVCECLVEGGGGARIEVELRCLQLVHRQVLRLLEDAPLPVDEIVIEGARHLTWDEARERRQALPPIALEALAREPLRRTIGFPAGVEEERLGAAGRIDRTWRPIEASIGIAAHAVTPEVWRVTVEVANRGDWQGTVRREAQRHALLQAHLVLRVTDAPGFVSLTDPPAAAAEAAHACRNRGVWPVLVGEPGTRDTLLASPIVLEDHPRVAPETSNDLFDGAEIAELLDLSILALTDDEKREMAATDAEARAILERVESLDHAAHERLHGVLRPVGRQADRREAP